jgi:hypothetical protein
MMNSFMANGADNEEALSLNSIFLGKPVEVTMAIESINKVRAQQILSSPYKRQRSINKALIEKLAQAMNANEFIEAIPNPIYISERGTLLDGQHRLTALTQTDRTIQFLMAYGLPESAFVYFDQNRPRSLRDALQTNGVANAEKVASATKLLYQLIAGRLNVPRNEVAVRIVGDYPSFEKAVAFAESICDNTHIVTSVGAVLYFLYSVNHAEACDTFFDILRHGDRDVFRHTNHPITMLSRKLNEEWKRVRMGRRYEAVPSTISYSGYPAFETRHLLMSWIHQAFMSYAAGKRSLRWEPVANTPSVIEEIGSMARLTVRVRHGYHES